MTRRAGAVPIRQEVKPSSIDDAIATIEQRKMIAEFEEVKRLAEQVFPDEWTVRVDQFSDGVHVQVRYWIAHDRTPAGALRKAIDWYRAQKGSRIVLPK